MRKINNGTDPANGHGCRCVPLMILLFLAGASLTQAQPSRFAAAYYNRGNERFKNGDIVRAIVDYDAALISYPRWSNAYIMRGSARYHDGDFDGSYLT